MPQSPRQVSDTTPKLQIKKKRTGPKLIMNVHNTTYQVIIDAAKEVGFKTRLTDPCLFLNPYIAQGDPKEMPQPEEFDVCWFDLAIAPEVLHKLKPYQRVS